MGNPRAVKGPNLTPQHNGKLLSLVHCRVREEIWSPSEGTCLSLVCKQVGPGEPRKEAACQPICCKSGWNAGPDGQSVVDIQEGVCEQQLAEQYLLQMKAQAQKGDVSGGLRAQMQIFLPLQGVRRPDFTCCMKTSLCYLCPSQSTNVWGIQCAPHVPALCQTLPVHSSPWVLIAEKAEKAAPILQKRNLRLRELK